MTTLTTGIQIKKGQVFGYITKGILEIFVISSADRSDVSARNISNAKDFIRFETPIFEILLSSNKVKLIKQDVDMDSITPLIHNAV